MKPWERYSQDNQSTSGPSPATTSTSPQKKPWEKHGQPAAAPARGDTAPPAGPFRYSGANTAPEKDKPEGFIGAGVSGFKSAANRIGSTVDAYQGDTAGVEAGALKAQEIGRTEEQEAFSTAIESNQEKRGDESVTAGIANVAEAAWDEPVGALHETVAQLPNSAAPLAGMWAGAKLGGMAGGAVGGPAAPATAAIGAIAGGLIGMFAGNTLIETGGIAQGKADDGVVTKEELSEARGQGATKAGVITTVDGATIGLNRLLFGAPGKAVEKVVSQKLADKGVDLANPKAVSAALSNKKILEEITPDAEKAFAAAMTKTRRAGRGVAGLALESAGEGVGEYLGSTAAGLDASFTEAALESLLSIPQSAVEMNVAKRLDSPGRMTVETAKNIGAHMGEEEAGVLQSPGIAPAERMKAAKVVADRMKQDSPAMSQAFMAHANQRIRQGRALMDSGESSFYEVLPPEDQKAVADEVLALPKPQDMGHAPIPLGPRGFSGGGFESQVKPSERMGLNPNDGPISEAAVMAVDSGAAPVPAQFTQAATEAAQSRSRALPAPDYSDFGETLSGLTQAIDRGRQSRVARDQQSITDIERSIRDLKQSNFSAPIDPSQDDLLTMIAKAGGISREDAQRQGIDPAAFGLRRGVNPVFRKDGGNSFDGMAENLGQYGFFQDGQYSANELLDMVSNAMAGSSVYAPAGIERQAQINDLVQSQEDLRARIKETEQNIGKLGEDEIYFAGELYQMMRQGATLEEVEAAIDAMDVDRGEFFENMAIITGAKNGQFQTGQRANEGDSQADSQGLPEEFQQTEAATPEAGWNGLSVNERARVLLDAGRWTANNGDLNVIGKKIAVSEWGRLPEQARGAVAGLIGGQGEATNDQIQQLQTPGVVQGAGEAPAPTAPQTGPQGLSEGISNEQSSATAGQGQSVSSGVGLPAASSQAGRLPGSSQGEAATVRAEPESEVAGRQRANQGDDGARPGAITNEQPKAASPAPGQSPGSNAVPNDAGMADTGGNEGNVSVAGSEEGANGPSVAPTQPDIDAAANEAATSPTNNTSEPSDGQKKAGNYKVGKFSWNGLQISIENPKDSTRSGTDRNGNEWSNTMAAHYGYIRGTEGKDGDHVDIFMGGNPDSDKVYVIDQRRQNGNKGAFDEHKILLGFDNKMDATRAYKDSYSKGWGVGPMTTTDVADFKDWLENGDTKRPFADRPASSVSGETDTAPSPTPARPASSPKPDRLQQKSDDLDARIDEAAAELAELLKPKPGTLNTGVDPQVLMAGAKLGALYAEKGVVKFAQWAREIVNKLRSMGVDPDQIKPHLKEIYAATQQRVTDEQFDQMDDARTVRGVDLDAVLAGESAESAETDYNSTTDIEDSSNAAVDRPGPRALENVPAEEVQGPGGEGAGSAEQGAVRGGATDGQGGGSTGGRSGNVRSGSVDTSEGDLFASPTGAGSTESPRSGGITGKTPSIDFTITDDFDLGGGGERQKFRDNVAAIKLLKALEAAERRATPDEQVVLARYVGWGGLPQAFTKSDGSTRKGWEKEAAELKELLAEEEYAAARRSTQDAHYTSKPVIDAIYSAVSRFGFKKGKVLEPSVGAGNFFGLMPRSMREESSLNAVELDHITGGIAKQLYQSANIRAPQGFQDFAMADGTYDLAIGNPPFGSQQIYDGKRKAISKFSIHNYFFGKSLDALREDGVLAMVVSNSLLDKKGSKEREYLASKADLIGAIRLPNTAFKANAGTEVTTDIIFLRKLREGETSSGNWTKAVPFVGADGAQMSINQYFSDNPEMMLGEMRAEGSMYRSDEPALIAPKGQDLAAELESAIAKLPEGFYSEEPRSQQRPDATRPGKAKTPSNESEFVKVNGFYYDNDKLIVRLPDDPETRKRNWRDAESRIASSGEAKPYSKAQIDRIKGMVDIGIAVSKVLDSQLGGASDLDLKILRGNLNNNYDAFVKKFGFINSATNKSLMRGDPSWPRLAALEKNYDKGASKAVARSTGQRERPPSAEKSDIFSKRTQQPYTPVSKVSRPKEGLMVSLSEKGHLDIDHIAEISDTDRDTAIDELGDLVYEDPVEGWVTNEQYLTGNVKLKLQQAKDAANQDAKFARNVSALEAVQPKDIPAVDIKVKLGAPWLPPQVLTDFVDYLAGREVGASFLHNRAAASWSVGPYRTAPKLENEWGASGFDAVELIQKEANGKQPTVYRTVRSPDGDKRVLDQEATDAAKQKLNEIKEEFDDWLWRSADRREGLGRLYNDTYNTSVERYYDGSHLVLPGKVPDDIISLRPHQKNFIWRVLQGKTTLADHVVGAGKTFAMVGAAMELKRTGLANKPMIVVPNHLVQQWSNDFLALYPNANILAPTKEDFKKDRRKELFAKVATGDWDAVIIAHSSFKKLPSDPAEEQAFVRQQIKDLEESIDEMRMAQGKDPRSVKDAEKAKDRLEEKLKGLLDQGDKDTDNLTFRELGVDSVFVDEAHEFKNLAYQTAQGRLPGLGSPKGSQKAQDLFVKVQSVLRSTKGRNIVFATGTPVTNSMVELYTMQRYLGYEALREKGLAHVDAWINLFGEIVSDFELDSTAQGYKINSRLSKFVNMPELMQMYNEFADSITRDDINESLKAQGKILPIPKIKGGKPENIIVPRSSAQDSYMADIVSRAENIPPDKSEDNMLKITGDARKAALDMRLVDSTATEEDSAKTAEAVEQIKRISNAWDGDKGTQLVFLDLSTPKKSAAKEKAKYEDVVRRADEGDESAQADLEKYTMDDISALEGDFSVYDDMKARLIGAGFDESEIAFIHDANTDEQKDALFSKVRSGVIRVLMGSTSKMGAGTNVQERLVAMHHMDAPWRPADLEQREGRIIRQGNALYDKYPDFEIEILRYATERTYDARMWQTIEGKARFIEQMRAGAVESREVEDIDGEAASAAEMKAVSSGNPLILEEFKLRAEISKLASLKKSHERKQYGIVDQIRGYERRVEILPEIIANAETDLETLSANPIKKSKTNPTGFEATINGKKYAKRDDAGKAVAMEIAKFLKTGKESVDGIGSYRGFDINLVRVNAETADIVLTGKREYNIGMPKVGDIAPAGVAARLQNALAPIPDEPARLEKQLGTAKEDLEETRKAEGGEFKQEAELRDAKERHKQVLKELSEKDKKEGDDTDSDSAARLRSGPMATPTRVPLQDATDTVSRITLDWSPEAVKRVRTVANFADLPAAVQDDVRQAGGSERTKGIFHTLSRTVYVIAGNHSNLADLEETVFHEGYGHLGLAGLFGKEVKTKMNQLWLAIGGDKGIRESAKRNNINLEGYFRDAEKGVNEGKLSQKARNQVMMEELLSHLAQDQRPSVKKRLQELMGAIRQWLRFTGFVELGKLSDGELFVLLRRSKDAIKTNSFDKSFYIDSTPMFRSQPSWYRSALADTVAGMGKIADKQGMVKPGQAIMWLKSQQKKGAFKQDEFDLSGVEEWLYGMAMENGLQGKPDKVAVDDIQTFVDANGVQIEEVELAPMSARAQELEAARVQRGLSQDEWAELQAARYGGNTPLTQYDSWTLPGGDNYRELLLTLPPASKGAPSLEDMSLEHLISVLEWNDPNGDYRDPDMPLEKDQAIAVIEQWAEEEEMSVAEFLGGNPASQGYKSSHWEQPNVLAHIRMNDRTDADGNRVLFIEEIQSDWAQDKRKGKDVPDAPFINETKAWTGLAMKRVIGYAAQNGYDRVAFINGEQSAERYDLSKRVSLIQYQPKAAPSGDTVYEVDAFDRNDQPLIRENALTAEQLEETLGKEMAERIVDDDYTAKRGPNRRISGVELKVGGEGMKAYYDQIVPQVARSVLKKVGGWKMESVALDDGREQPGFTVTDKMREKVSQGLPLFRKEDHPFTLTGENASDNSDTGRQAQAILARNWNGTPEESVAAAVQEARATANRDVVDWLQTNAHRVQPPEAGVLFRTADDVAAEKLGMGGRDGGLADTIRDWKSRDWKATMQDFRQRVYEGAFDGLIGLKRAEDAAGKGMKVGDYANAGYVGARLATGVADLMHAILHYGAPMWKGGVVEYKPGTQGLLETFSDLGDDLNDWLKWMAGNRGQELLDQGRENNLTQDDIDALVAVADGKLEKFERARAEYNKLNSAMLDLAEEAGLIKPGTRQEWESEWYVPFYRRSDADGDAPLLGPRTKRGLSHQSAGIKKLKGGDTSTNDLLENVITNWLKLADSSMKNMALLKSVDNLADTESLSDETTRWRKVTVSKSEIASRIRKDRKLMAAVAEFLGMEGGATLDKVANELAKVDDEGFEQLWGPVAPTDPDIIQVRRAGKAEYYRVNDPALLRAITHLQSTGFNDPVTRAGRWFKRLLTTGVTASPDFILRNFIRDAAHAWAINPSSDKFAFGKDSLKGLYGAIKQDPAYRELMFSGASFQGGYVHGTDPERSAQQIRRALERKGLSKRQIDAHMGSVLDTPAKMQAALSRGWQAYREAGDKVENANRLATFKAARASGKPLAQAVFEAKDLMDYSLRGNFQAMVWLTDVVPFLNARLQGLSKLGRATMEDKRAVGLAIGKIALFSVALAAMNDDDDRYQELQDWEKDAYWHFWIGDDHWRIPKPFEIGIIAGTIPERIYHAWLTDNQPPEKVQQALVHGMVETLNFNPLPQAIIPAIEVWGNRSFYFDTPIEGMSDTGKRPQDRYGPHTSTSMVELGQLFGVSPKKLEHIWEGYTGTMGAYALSAADMMVRAVRTGDVPRPKWEAKDLPVAKSFYRGDTPARSTQYITDLYDRLEEVNQIHRAVLDYQKYDPGKARELVAEEGDKLKLRSGMNRARLQLSSLRRARSRIYADATMTPRAKTARLNQINEQINEIAERVSKATEEAF